MALYSLCLRRALSLSSSFIKHQRPISSLPAISSTPSLSSTLNPQNPKLDLTHPQLKNHLPQLPFQSRKFRSSTISLSSRARSPSYNRDVEDDKIGPETILFEGCDYNHWLITMDFPKDPKPTPEEMVETYVQTCAKVVGSVEEAKKLIYACSTTTYQGFQVQVSEEMSEKFKGLPGVVFVLPDSYIDPVNKEYGGDKYINGTIIPRPPPVQYGRQGGRYGDRNRDSNRQNQSRGSMPYQRGNSAYANQGSMHGDARNYGPQQNTTPQQNYGQPGIGERRDFMPMNNAPGGRGKFQDDRRDPMPSHQANYNQGSMRGDAWNYGAQQNPPPQQNYGPPGAGERRDFMPMNNVPGGRDNYNQGSIHGDARNYGAQQNPPPQQNCDPPGAGERRDFMPMNNVPGGRDNYQGDRRDPMPSHQANYNQGEQGNYYSQGQRDYSPGDQRGYAPPEQGDFRGDNQNYAPPHGGAYGQGIGGAHGPEIGHGYGQNYPRHGEDQRISQMEQRNNTQGEQRNHVAMGHGVTDQGRF